MNENFMKEKPVFPLLMSMALPMVISMMVNALYNIVDSFFVAKISEDAMTALSTAEFCKCCGDRIWCWNKRGDSHISWSQGQ